MKNLTPLSKFVSLVLRHKPVEFGITLDADGFTGFDALLDLVQRNYGAKFTRDDLLAVIEADAHGKKRFEISDGRVRALFGHSGGSPEMSYPQAAPPERLYHGTVRRFAHQIMLEGLTPQTRQFVHLTTNREEAVRVGKRHGHDFVLLRIRAADAHAAGIAFYQADNERFLVKHLPAEFIGEE